MEPTLNINDRVLVVKDKFYDIDYQVGDIIVFYNPNYVYEKNTYQEFYESLQVWNINQKQLSIDTAFIKRIVGLEGDIIQIDKNGNLLNNGKIIEINNMYLESFGKEAFYTVPKNTVFVIGDNIRNSIDSRVYGSVNFNQIIGKAIYKIFPLNEIKIINDWK